MKSLLKAGGNRQKFFDALSDILTGEAGPYQCVPLLEADADETRRNVLFAFSSPKHERLLSLIDNRVIDRLEVVAPDGKTARNQVAKQIAKIAAADNASADVTLIDSDDLIKTVRFLLNGFARWYVQQGFNFENRLDGIQDGSGGCGDSVGHVQSHTIIFTLVAGSEGMARILRPPSMTIVGTRCRPATLAASNRTCPARTSLCALVRIGLVKPNARMLRAT
jgi:hypothetical protein